MTFCIACSRGRGGQGENIARFLAYNGLARLLHYKRGEQEVRVSMEKRQLVRVLSKKDVISLSFGAMIGWGWVVLAGYWILEAGTIGSILAFLIGGLMVVFVGLAYAELVSAMPKVGGELVYTLRDRKSTRLNSSHVKIS